MLDPSALDDVGQVDVLEEVRQILRLALGCPVGQHQGQAAVQKVIVPGLLLCPPMGGEKLAKGEWMDADFVTAPAKLGDHVRGEESGVAARDVNVNVISPDEREDPDEEQEIKVDFVLVPLLLPQ